MSLIADRHRTAEWKSIPLRRVGLALIALLLTLVITGCGDARLGQAGTLERGHDLKAANDLYRRILRDDPNNMRAVKGLAVNLSQLGLFDEALPCQEKVVKADLKDAQTRVELGFNYLNHQGRQKDGLHLLQEAATLDGSARNRTFVAQARLATNDVVGAERDLRAIIKDDVSYPFAYSLLAGLLEKQGRKAEAAGVKRSADEHGIKLDDSTT